jgi:hypothetical protein
LTSGRKSGTSGIDPVAATLAHIIAEGEGMAEQPAYRSLDGTRIAAAIRVLTERIRDRFPDASLAQVSSELLSIANEHGGRVARIARPHRVLRLLIGGLVAAALGLMVYVIALIDFTKTNADSVYSVLQGIEASINLAVLAAAALLFLFTWEQRLKRSRALRALAELRSIVHVIDMHQLTKDPAALLARGPTTPHSPPRTMTPFELGRYLDYCAELLALTGKVAALYAERLPDPVVVDAVSDLERLTTGLSQKVWQKISILELARPE